MITIIGLLVLCMVASFSDVRRRTISNIVVLMILVLGTGQSLYFYGLFHTIQSIGLCILIAIVLFPMYMFGALGAGDVKLYSLIPLFYNYDRLVILYFVVFLVAALIAIIGSVRTLPLKQHLKHIHFFLMHLFAGPKIVGVDLPHFCKKRIPMAVPLTIGVLLSIISDNIGWIDFY